MTKINADAETATTLHVLAASLQDATGLDGALALGLTLFGLAAALLLVSAAVGSILEDEPPEQR